MKILIFGISGMLGSSLFAQLGRHKDFDLVGTQRSESLKATNSLGRRPARFVLIDAIDFSRVSELLAAERPEWVVNCIGAVKQLQSAKEPVSAITLNSLFPRQLEMLAGTLGYRLLHFSTDCVFSGARGMYSESDLPDATDLYGRSKLLGEVDAPGCLTLRTSMIGPELNSAHGLLEWYLSQKKPVKGYKKAIFSGLTTLELAKLTAKLIESANDLSGVYHVAAAPIDKFSLLGELKRVYLGAADIVPEEDTVIDRSLDGRRFDLAAGYKAPSWPQMIDEMRAHDPRK